MKPMVIPVHAGEEYPYGFDFSGWIAGGDVPTAIIAITQVEKSEGAPDLVIGASAITEGTVAAEILVPDDAAVGVKYKVVAVVDTAKGGKNQRCYGILEVIE